MNRSNIALKLLASAVISVGLSTGATAATVYANNSAPGDAFTNGGIPDAAQAVGASGWYYNNVRLDGSIGINTSNARSGNASVVMSGGNPDPVSGASAKADIEYYGALGSFSAFSGMSYDWFRASGGDAAAHLHPSLRILLDIDGNSATADYGALIFERAYNPGVTDAPTDVWQSDTIGANTILWNNGGVGIGDPIYKSLTDWQSQLARATIIGFSSGFGSGWGSFSGAVDNIGWTINSSTTVTNFEVAGAAVPEPGTLALLGLALVGLAFSRRRKT